MLKFQDVSISYYLISTGIFIIKSYMDFDISKFGGRSRPSSPVSVRLLLDGVQLRLLKPPPV